MMQNLFMTTTKTLIKLRLIFGSIVVHVIIIVQWNQTARLYEIQVTDIYSRAVLVAVTFYRRCLYVIQLPGSIKNLKTELSL